MGVRVDMTGRTCGRWTVTGPGPSRAGDAYWMCRCACGVERAVVGKDLRRGGSVSCGCYQAEAVSAALTTHGQSQHSPEYQAWRSMLGRCLQKRRGSYPNYGGRGITVCDEWKLSFEAFISHIGPRPSPGHSVDRINNDGNYEPSNVRWATRSQQQQNRRPILRAVKAPT